MTEVRCKTAVELLEKHLDTLPHPKGLVRLVQFTHDSPGLQRLRRQIAEALVMLIERDHTISKRRTRGG